MIRKFKHTPTGLIATNEGLLKGLYRVGTMGILDACIIENTCDWQEIQEPKYQILSFQHPTNGNVYNLNKDGTYGYEKFENTKTINAAIYLHGLKIPYGECLKRYPIHSVKRLSDGVVFTLRQKIMFSHYPEIQTIEKMQWHKDFIMFKPCESFYNCFQNLDYCKIAPIPPLTATITITYSDKRPKQTYTLNKGDGALIQF